MLYVIGDKCYVNIAPSVYVEVVVSKGGKITPTKNKVEITSTTNIQQTTVTDWLKKFVENEPLHTEYVMDRKKHNKRKK